MMIENLSPKEAGYIEIRTADSGVTIGLMKLAFTYAVCYDVNLDPLALPYKHRYCYPDFAECLDDYVTWDGYGNPDGNWIKMKGAGVEESNPNYVRKPSRKS